jgi:hypothetical protein
MAILNSPTDIGPGSAPARCQIQALILAISLAISIMIPADSTNPQSNSPVPATQALQESLKQEVSHAIARLTSPELEARKARRRALQQKGYADILFHLLQRDGLWGLFSYVRLSSQLEYSLPQNTLNTYLPLIYSPVRRDSSVWGFTGAPSGPMAVPLYEDRSFPEDPWQR